MSNLFLNYKPTRMHLIVGLSLLLIVPIKAFSQNRVPDAVLDIFEAKCSLSGCHIGGPAGDYPDLTENNAFDALVNQPSRDFGNLDLVRPGSIKKSYLILKILGTKNIKGARMPIGQDPVTREELKTIARWIKGISPNIKTAKKRSGNEVAFSGLTLGSLQTAQTMQGGTFSYRIAHRWNGRVRTGFAQFFGLDQGAHAYTSFSFPIIDRLTFTAGRSGINATITANLKLRILGESAPFSMALFGGTDWVTARNILDPNAPNTLLKRSGGERYAWYSQLIFSKKFFKRVSLLMNPGVLLNGNYLLPNEKPLFTIGLGSMFHFNRRLSLFVELSPILTGVDGALPAGGPAIRNNQPKIYDSFTAGMQHHIGGHVFHLYITNSLGLTPSQVMSGGNFRLASGEFRLGFNIHRGFKLPF